MNATLINSQRPQILSGMVVRAHRHRMGAENQPARTLPIQLVPLTPWPEISRYQSTSERSSADSRQAAYFVELLSQQLRRIDYRIVKCRQGIAAAELEGDVNNIHGFRRLMKAEQQERETVEGMLEKLRRRFRPPTAGNLP